MKVLILNSGKGSRMGDETRLHPKCMTELSPGETILSRQLKLLIAAGVKDVFITTGYLADILMDYCRSLSLSLEFHFIFNPDYDSTNYIYSIYCAREYLRDDDLLLMHGDLVFESPVLERMLACENSCVKISSTLPLPPKDFKAVIHDGKVSKIGVEFQGDDAVEAQALYKLKQEDWLIWLDRICEFCESGKRQCYAEAALNEISDRCCIYGYDAREQLCSEIDNSEDLEKIKKFFDKNKIPSGEKK